MYDCMCLCVVGSRLGLNRRYEEQEKGGKGAGKGQLYAPGAARMFHRPKEAEEAPDTNQETNYEDIIGTREQQEKDLKRCVTDSVMRSVVHAICVVAPCSLSRLHGSTVLGARGLNKRPCSRAGGCSFSCARWASSAAGWTRGGCRVFFCAVLCV